jgi:hypothetical protein
VTLDTLTSMPRPLASGEYAYPDHVAALSEQVSQLEMSNEYLQESLAELEMDDRGWTAFTAHIEQEFSGTGRQRVVGVCRMMAIAHPLLKRGLTVRAGYIWGQGVEVTARVPSADGSADPVLQDAVNQIIDGFEKLNESTFTGMGARDELERAQGTDGEVFLALFTDPASGQVKVRTVPQMQIQQIVCNPEDDADPWFYIREYVARGIPKQGESLEAPPTTVKRVIYPALGFEPRTAGLGFKPRVINGAEVMWDAPMVHVPVNRLDGWQRGIPDVYASVAWARLYQDFLVDWSRLTKALATIAWKATGETKSRAANAAVKIRASTVPTGDTATGVVRRPEAGGTVVTGPGNTFEAVSKSGATIDSESGKPLASMVAAGLGVSVITLLTDPGQTGARAVAETLDTPTILEMGMRRLLWQSALQRILQHAITTAGMQSGSKIRALTGDRMPVLEFSWPPLAGLDPLQLVAAIVQADTTGKMPPLTTVRLLLSALGVANVDEVLAEVTDEEGHFVDPGVTAGDVAVNAFNNGHDPAEAVR